LEQQIHYFAAQINTEYKDPKAELSGISADHLKSPVQQRHELGVQQKHELGV